MSLGKIQVSKKTLIVFLLWAFAPLAWVLMWRDKKYHSWFPKLLWVNGIIFLAIFVSQSFSFVPKLGKFFEENGVSVPSNMPFNVALIIIVFTLIQIPLGFLLQKFLKRHKQFTDDVVIPIIIIFAIDGILGFSTGLITRYTPVGIFDKTQTEKAQSIQITPSPAPSRSNYESPKLLPTPTISPTKKPLSAKDREAKYGPCVEAPVLTYHHIEPLENARKNNRLGLAVTPEMLATHFEYIKEKGYSVITMWDLVSFFDSNISLPKKPILITFDDGYQDFYDNAYPLLREYDFHATMFTPTGLLDNPEYLSWKSVTEIKQSGLVLFANHTWSHKNVNVKLTENKVEIETADLQLTERGLNSPKVFAYPYGAANAEAKEILNALNYKLAFTTISGRVLCKKESLSLPRVRVGNRELKFFGI